MCCGNGTALRSWERAGRVVKVCAHLCRPLGGFAVESSEVCWCSLRRGLGVATARGQDRQGCQQLASGIAKSACGFRWEAPLPTDCPRQAAARSGAAIRRAQLGALLLPPLEGSGADLLIRREEGKWVQMSACDLCLQPHLQLVCGRCDMGVCSLFLLCDFSRVGALRP